jgi:ribosomal protein uL13
MKVIEGKNATLGRLSSYVAKQALKGEEIAVVNCNDIIITGTRKNIEETFKEKRSRVGSSQKGPKIHRSSEKIVKRTIRGMLPNHRFGRGRIAFKKIKCYNKLPKEFEEIKLVTIGKAKKGKFVTVKDLK